MRPTAGQRSEAAWVAAVGNTTRLAIIRALAAGEKTVTELVGAVRDEVQNVSHHLGIMKAAGVVTAQRAGRFQRYSLVGGRAVGGCLELAHPSGTRITIPLG